MKQESYITVTYGLRGFYAVLVVWRKDFEDDSEGFYEPYMTGIGSYPTEAGAVPEAVTWARDEHVAFKLLGYDDKGNQLS